MVASRGEPGRRGRKKATPVNKIGAVSPAWSARVNPAGISSAAVAVPRSSAVVIAALRSDRSTTVKRPDEVNASTSALVDQLLTVRSNANGSYQLANRTFRAIVVPKPGPLRAAIDSGGTLTLHWAALAGRMPRANGRSLAADRRWLLST